MNRVIHSIFPKKVRKPNNSGKNKPNYSYECLLAKRVFKKTQRDFRNDKDNLDRRHIYLREKKKYRKIIYKTTKLAKENKINQLAKLEHSDSKEFWKKIKEFTSPRDDVTKNISPDKWSNHFESLLKTPPTEGSDTQFRDYVNECLPILENISNHSIELNKEITLDELNFSIKGIKKGKRAFLDDISNDAIKNGVQYLDKSLIHLYNTVLSFGVFPDIWGESLVIPLHKKGDKMNVNNYRGIMIASSVGKLFLKILTKRIDEYMKSNSKWCLNQCGFKEDHRTEDNLFILQSIYCSHVENNNGKMFVAFVDFSKFFDKINRQFLRYKLSKYGITGKIYDIIKSMYNKTSYMVNIGDLISPIFDGTNGVKQGCVISPLLSNIFQNDLHDIFDVNASDPIKLGDIKLNSISWADDLILLSKSKLGLQTCLNNLEMYCKRWGLEVNIDKTKVMLFSKRSQKPVDLFYGKTRLECVKKFNYLGFLITDNFKFSHLINDRIMKSNRVYNLVLQAFRTSGNVNVSLAMSIFDKQIIPILLYGCAIWSPPNTQNYIYIHNQPEERNTRSIVTELLKSNGEKSIPFVSARRVGRKGSTVSRKILVKLRNYDDKESFLRKNFDFVSNFDSKMPHKIELVHTNFCKRSLNINKYSSTTGVMMEMARYPIMHNAYSLAIKYWLRLKSGTKNQLLNEAFKLTVRENHDWNQSIQNILCKNGFRNVWLDPDQVNKNTFHRMFRSRLNNQYEQLLAAKIRESDRLVLLSSLKENFHRSHYLDKIKSPDIRAIFTRLRIDMNNLNSCRFRFRKVMSPDCPNCSQQVETVEHLLLQCKTFDNLRDTFIRKMVVKYPRFVQMSNDHKLKVILNLDCPQENINICCNYVKDIYKAREAV